MALTDEAIDKIKQMIITGQVQPGERLPREAELGTMLGLSRNSLREAVRALSLINVLDVRQGDGTYVTSLAPGLLFEAMAFVVDVQHDASVVDFLEVRRILEPVATAMATRRMSDEDLEGLGRLVDDLGEAPSVEELVEADREFHRRIAAASGNDVLAAVIESLSGRTHRARVWRGLTQESAVARTLDEHRAIWQAMRARQADVAQAWASVHVAGVEQWVRQVLVEGDSSSPAP
ncbi:FadR/GntR family transcriptional regulator [uncultured Pseudokineococcus sp.]|uniref:FadR/GntR family transcriptional regulator n=1 Tax=uncultured Pseudokineococcus sp. TaxID=1642928 RepID=UPI002617B492|nr:FadR/GntR family transcriptional regulator [uncultured Pseudokineococcus sp.]